MELRHPALFYLDIMRTLSYYELNNFLEGLLQPRPNEPSYIFDAFADMYNTGVRPSELFIADRWNANPSGSYTLVPLKNNNARVFQGSQLSTRLKEAISAGGRLYFPFSVRRLRYHFHRFSQYPFAMVGDRQVELYMFRYRYVKGLKLMGLTDEEIIIEMGWTRPTVLPGYLNADIQVFS